MSLRDSQVPEEDGQRARAEPDAGDQRGVRGAATGRAASGGGRAQREADQDHDAPLGHEVHIGVKRSADVCGDVGDDGRATVVRFRRGRSHRRGHRKSVDDDVAVVVRVVHVVRVVVHVVRAARFGRLELLPVAVHVRRRRFAAQRIRFRFAGRLWRRRQRLLVYRRFSIVQPSSSSSSSSFVGRGVFARRHRRRRVLHAVAVVVFRVGHGRGGRRLPVAVFAPATARRFSRGRCGRVHAVRRSPVAAHRLQRRPVHVRRQFRVHRIQLSLTGSPAAAAV